MPEVKSRKIKFSYVAVLIIVLACLIFGLSSTYSLTAGIDMSNRKTVFNYASQVAFRLKDRFTRIDVSLKEMIKDIAEQEMDLAGLLKRLEDYDTVWEESGSGVLFEDGTAMLSDGEAFRFKNEIALQDVVSYSDRLNISQQVIKSVEVLVFSKPCEIRLEDRNIIGMFSILELKKLEDLLGEYSYSTGSFLALVKNDGDNIWKQANENPNSGTNCFEDLQKLKLNKSDSVTQMKNRMKVSMDGTILYTKGGQEYYLAYVPLHINYWYLLVSTRSGTIDYTLLYRQHYIISGVLLTVIVIMGLLGLIYMIQKNKKMAEDNKKLLRATELANQANEAKRDFLAKASHEIRTPLNGVMGMVELAILDYPNKEKCLKDLEKGLVSAGHLQSLINDVLDMSRIESGKLKLVYENVDFQKLKQELEVLLETDMLNKHLSVTIDNTRLQHRYFLADYLRLKQILMNFIFNAVKYTKEGDCISVTFREEEEQGKTQVVISVKDNGKGISREKIEAIFEPFEQGELPVENTGGVGLGLSIVKKIVEAMNGNIQVDSELGTGSTFTATLPLMVGRDPQEVTADKEETDLHGISILMAEDNELNAEIASELLKDKGAHVTWARDGEEVVTMFRQAPRGSYQVILMDIQMPKKNGMEAAVMIRQTEQEMNEGRSIPIPIIAMTANAFEEQKEAMLLAGIDEFLYKPIDINQVCSCIRNRIEETKRI